jgi:hypothetical protein
MLQIEAQLFFIRTWYAGPCLGIIFGERQDDPNAHWSGGTAPGYPKFQ